MQQISSDVLIMTRAEFAEHQKEAYKRGVERGKFEANWKDTGGPDQGGEFKRGMPGHPDNDMGM